MNTKSHRNGEIWSAAAVTPLWLRTERTLLLRCSAVTSQSATVGSALQKGDIVRLLREMTA